MSTSALGQTWCICRPRIDARTQGIDVEAAYTLAARTPGQGVQTPSTRGVQDLSMNVRINISDDSFVHVPILRTKI